MNPFAFGAPGVKGFELDPKTILDISPHVLDDNGRIRILPASTWAETTRRERGLFGHRTGIYSFPTVELVEHLGGIIAGKSAIEIGAGNGVLAEALGIPAIDNRMQEREPYRSAILGAGQPLVPYGPNIVANDAGRAVRKYQPDVVIACWVTHKYDPKRHWAGGNEIGIDEADVLRNCGLYVVVGNEHVHENKAIWSRRYTITYPNFVYSRAMNGSRDFIAVWKGGRA